MKQCILICSVLLLTLGSCQSEGPQNLLDGNSQNEEENPYDTQTNGNDTNPGGDNTNTSGGDDPGLFTTHLMAQLTGFRAVDITIDTLMINIEDIELEFDEDHSGQGGGDDFDDIELEGPFEILLTPEGITVPIVDVEIPEGTYEELEFDLRKSHNPESPLFDQSIRITGTLDGTPFLFWHDFNDTFEIDFEDHEVDIDISSDGTTITINFDLSFLFETTEVDLDEAQDGNGDGLIEISPEDPDGNQDLAQDIRDLIRDAIDLLDD